jgi:hypothetical protein
MDFKEILIILCGLFLISIFQFQGLNASPYDGHPYSFTIEYDLINIGDYTCTLIANDCEYRYGSKDGGIDGWFATTGLESIGSYVFPKNRANVTFWLDSPSAKAIIKLNRFMENSPNHWVEDGHTYRLVVLPIFFYFLSFEDITPSIPIKAAYVSNEGNDENNGTSKENPLANVNTALNRIKDNGTIYILDNLNLSETININKNVTIKSESDRIILTGDGKNRIMNIEPGLNVNIDNLNLTNGYTTENGGGIQDEGSNITIKNSIIDSNTAIQDGGGIYITKPIINNNKIKCEIDNCTIIRNTANNSGGISIMGEDNTICNINKSSILFNKANSNGGGMIVGQNPNGLIERCNISGNEAKDDGGGIWIKNATGIFKECNISLNKAEHNGGGVHIENNIGILTDCSINNNNAGEDGGGVCVKGYGEFTNFTIDNNVASRNGGGIWNNKTLILHEVDFFNDTAYGDGGGIWNNNTLKTNESDFYENTGNRNGGGIWNGGNLSMAYTLISMNEALDGGGIYNDKGSTIVLLNPPIMVLNNNIATGSGKVAGGMVIPRGSEEITNYAVFQRNMPIDYYFITN